MSFKITTQVFVFLSSFVFLNCYAIVADQYEPDNTFSQAKLISFGEVQSHTMSPRRDDDWVKFVVLKNNTNIELNIYSTSSNYPHMYLYDSNQQRLEHSGFHRYLRYSSLQRGTYYVWIEHSSYARELEYNIELKSTAATLVSPIGRTADNQPTYKWNAVDNSTWYYLWVNDSTGNKIKTWYTAEQAGCVGGSPFSCSVTPSVTLANGSARWWIQIWNSSGEGPWSQQGSFEVVNNDDSKPIATTLVSPLSTTSDNTPTYKWNAVDNSTWYYLWVNDATGNKIKRWYTAAQAGCTGSASTCSITPSVTLANGAAKWWVQTWNSNGHGPWSHTGNVIFR